MLNTQTDVLLKILMLSCKHVENHTYSYREILLSHVNKSFSNRFSFFLMALLLKEISHYVICVYTENSLTVRCLRFRYGTTACCARRSDSTLLIGRNSSALWLTVVEGVFFVSNTWLSSSVQLKMLCSFTLKKYRFDQCVIIFTLWWFYRVYILHI